MKIKKTVLVAMASALILGLGANLQSLPTASARHIRTYRVRRHRTYRRRNVSRHKTYRKHQVRHHITKRYKRTYRHIRRPRQARRIRRHYRRRTAYTYRPKAGKLSTRNDYKSYQRFSKKQIAAWAKCDEYSPKDFIKFNEQVAPTYGQYVKPYCLQGVVYLLSKYQLNHLAHTLDNMSGAEYVKKFTTPMHPKNMKYWTYDGTYNNGFLNNQGVKVAETDVIKDLNNQRANLGESLVTQDPGLQLIAEKHAKMVNDNQIYSPHYDQNGNFYMADLAKQYNVPLDGAFGENVGTFYQDEEWEQPSEDAKTVNDEWDEGHTQNRDNPNWTKAGVGIYGDAVVEDYES